MKIANKSLMTVVVTAGVALFAGIAEAATVRFETVGFDSGLNAAFRDNFFRVTFEDAPENVYIQQLSLDLSLEPDAFFDFGGGPFSPGGFGAPPQVGNNSDVTNADITNYFLNSQQDRLTVNFEDGAFAVGEQLLFGLDTDNVGPSFFGLDFFDRGGDFGRADVTFDVTLSNGSFGTATFERQTGRRSVAVANIADPESVPESSTVLGLFAVWVLGGFSLKRLNQ